MQRLGDSQISGLTPFNNRADEEKVFLWKLCLILKWGNVKARLAIAIFA